MEKVLGNHTLVEFYECSPQLITDKDHVETMMLTAAKESGANIISSSFHQFSPQGVSGVIIISESHFTIHTWPELGYAAVDIFTCGYINNNMAIEILHEAFESKKSQIVMNIERGI